MTTTPSGPTDSVAPTSPVSTTEDVGSVALAGTDPLVRPAGLRDLAAIHSLYEALVQEHADPLAELASNATMVAWTLRRTRQQLLAEDRWLGAIAEDENGAVVGYAAVVVERQASVYKLELFGSLSEIYVIPVRRRRGIATRLVALLDEGLKQRGIDLVEASAPYGDGSANGFLTSRGFAPHQVQHLRRL